MSKREKIYFRVAKGMLIPADNYASSVLRDRGFHIGDLVAADLTKPRNPKFNNLVHQLGVLVTENIDAFHGMDAHKAIKRLQIEGGVACDEVGVVIKGFGMVTQRIPRSISFANMDEGEYQQAARGISRTIAENYWPSCSAEEIEHMASAMISEVA
jgi:hypothetical protein